MNFEEAGQRYVYLREQFEKRLISQEEFLRAVGELAVTTPDGKVWTLDPFAGLWVEKAPGRETPVSHLPSEGGEPQSLLQLLAILGKGMVKNLPKTIMIGLLMAVFTWAAHTYIIAKINDGLMYNPARIAINSVVHLQRTYFPGVNMFWGVLSYFLTSFLMRALSVGPQNWLKSIQQLPDNIRFSLQQDKTWGQKSLLAGVFLALLIMLIYRNFMLSWVLAVGFLLLLTARFASLEFLALKTAFSDLRRFLKREIVPRGMEYDCLYLLLAGLCAGFFLVGLWKARVSLTIIAMVLIAAYFVFMERQQQKPRGAFLFFLAASGLLLYGKSAFAWCEGASLSQVGGNWIEWWGMYNADLVRRLGLAPAGFSFTGGVLGAVAANLTSFLPSLFPFPGPQPWGVRESMAAGGSQIPDDASLKTQGSVAPYTPDDFVPEEPLDREPGEYEPEGPEEKGWLEQMGDFLETNAETAEWIKDVYTNFIDFMEHAIIAEINKHRIAIFEALNMKDPLEYAYWTSRGVDVSRVKLNEKIKSLSNALWYFDVLNDALKNVGKGDSYLDGFLKSVGSNYLGWAVGETAAGPTVALYEAANWLLFGGSEVKDIVSHINTEGGPALAG